MAEFPSDPGGIFASDAHRRVMAALANPDDAALSVEELMERVGRDDHLDADTAEVEEVLKDLEADGHAKKLKDGWKNTPSGFEALTGPPKEGL